MVTDLLPLDGREIQAEELYALAESGGTSRRTAMRRIMEGAESGLVLRRAALVGGRPGVLLSSGMEALLTMPRSYLEIASAAEELVPEAFRRREPGFRTREDLRLRLQVEIRTLLKALGIILVKASMAKTEEEARWVAEVATHHVLRRWLRGLAAVMWLRQPSSVVALDEAMTPLSVLAEGLSEEALGRMEAIRQRSRGRHSPRAPKEGKRP